MHDAFDVMGLEPGFALDTAELQRRFVALSAEAHPDRYTDPIEQADAAARAAKINEAYRVLRDPASRAEALLAQRGGPGKGDDKSLPSDLLMEVMEVRESMEQAIADDDQAKLAELRQWAEQRQTAHLEKIAELFASGDDPVETGKAVRLELNALRYAERMLEQMPG
jgi:molecular chaperone HscB